MIRYVQCIYQSQVHGDEKELVYVRRSRLELVLTDGAIRHLKRVCQLRHREHTWSGKCWESHFLS